MRHSIRSLAALALITGGVAVSLTADAAWSRVGAATVSFKAVGPAGLSIVGTTSELEVAEAAGVMTVRVPLANLDTGIGLRNKHMREKYLQVQLYPTAELAVPRASIKAPEGAGEAGGEATGTMTLHGQSKPVRFAYHAKRDGARTHVTGDVRVNIHDFGIDVPSYLGVTVKPDVGVTVTFDTTE